MRKAVSFMLTAALVVSMLCMGAVYPAAAESEQRDIAGELEGYTRIFLSSFKTVAGNALQISATSGGTAVSNTASSRFYSTVDAEASDSYLLDKTYFDFDINLAEATNAPSIMLYERSDWNDYLRLKFNNTSGTLSLAYISTHTGSTITRFNESFSLIDYGRTSATEFFNVKIRADFSPNSIDATKRDATFQLWINNRFATEETLMGEDMRNGLMIRPGGETIRLREQKYLAAELDGYSRVDMLDFNKPLDANGVVSLASSDHATPGITDFHKTYFDADLLFAETGKQFQYQAYAKYFACFYVSFPNASSFRLGAYTDYANNKAVSTLTTVTASDYGIAVGEYFNIKIRTDIVHNGSSEDVTVQMWLNDGFAYEGTVTFNYGEADHIKDIRTTGAVSVRSALDTASQLYGYRRVTSEDFRNINGTKSEVGRDWVTARSGEYKGDGSDLSKSYFEADIKAPNDANPFMAWLSKNKTKTEMDFYGDGEQLRFYFSGTTLKLMKVHAGANAGKETFADLSLAPYGYSADTFFNFKVKTDIYSDSLIGITVWVNGHFVKKIFIDTYDAETVADMTCAGFRGTAGQPVYVRTPVMQDEADVSLPVFDPEQHIKTVNYTGTVANGALEAFDYHVENLSAPCFLQYTVAASQIAENTSVVLALAETDRVEAGENCFFSLCLTPENGWGIRLLDGTLVSRYDDLSAQNYPDTNTPSAGDCTVTAKTENGLLSLWINGILVCNNYKNADYHIISLKAAVYSDAAPVEIAVEVWCEKDNYNLLGDLNGDLCVDIRDLVRMKRVAEKTEGVTFVSGYVVAFNDDGTIGSSELTLMKRYLIGSVTTLAGDEIRLIAPRNGTVTAHASEAVNTLTTDYDYTAYQAEPFRLLHKDQYFRGATVLKWKCFQNDGQYTVRIGTEETLSDAVSYTAQTSELQIHNLLPDTTYYWQVTSDSFASGVFTFVTADTVRTLTVSGISNTRDIGGYDIGDTGRMKYGMVFRGAKLDGISAASRSVLLDELGVKTDLDLRGNGGTSPLGNSVNYYSYSAPYYWNATRGINAGGDYQTALVNSVRVFADPSNYPIYLHCSLGRDRTGTLALLISGLCGVGKSDLFLDYELSFLSEVGSTGDSLTTPVMVGDNFSAMYDQIQSYAPSGSFADACEAFMLSIGITQNEIHTIRSVLIESK